jgi:hypothetical protein
VVSKVYESHKLTQGEELGKPRRLGARMAPGPDGQDPVFGKASQRGNEPGAAELIRGWYTPEEQAPDPDLGKSLHEGFRNPTSPNMRVSSSDRCRFLVPLHHQHTAPVVGQLNATSNLTEPLLRLTHGAGSTVTMLCASCHSCPSVC